MKQQRFFYEPSRPVGIILDTDIGPDCDDAGAVAVLHALASLGEVEILGMMHCTSSKWGAGCLDALNTYYGRPDIPIGTLKTSGFLDDDSVHAKYNKGVAEHYPNRFREGAEPPDAVALYRQLLAGGERQSVVIVAIGPLPNLLNLLRSQPDEYSSLSGIQLVADKVKHLVVMGGAFPSGREWNFQMHPASAQYVASHWPTPITFAGFEIGADIHTGRRLFTHSKPDNPVRKSYEWYVGEGGDRHSWDLTAVLYAARGAYPYWDTVLGTVEVADNGENGWTVGENSRHAYLTVKMDPQQVADILEELMVKEP